MCARVFVWGYFVVFNSLNFLQTPCKCMYLGMYISCHIIKYRPHFLVYSMSTLSITGLISGLYCDSAVLTVVLLILFIQSSSFFVYGSLSFPVYLSLFILLHIPLSFSLSVDRIRSFSTNST